MRASRAAQPYTSGSIAPGAAVLSQTRSSPADSEHCDSRAGEILIDAKPHLTLRSGMLSPSSACPEHRRGRQYILVGHSRVVRKDIHFAPPHGHQANDNSTEGRVPRTTGLTARTSGSSVMREVSIVTGPAPPSTLLDFIWKRNAARPHFMIDDRVRRPASPWSTAIAAGLRWSPG